MPNMNEGVRERKKKLKSRKSRNSIEDAVNDNEAGSPPGYEDYDKMYNQPESMGGDPKGFTKGGMCKGMGAAIQGGKFTGVK